jgi:hypothetical protein
MRCDAILMLRAANKRAAQFRQMLGAKTGLDASLPADRVFGIWAHPAPVEDAAGFYRFLQAAVELGLLDAKEVSNGS